MTFEIGLTLGIILMALILFATEKLRVDLIALIVLLLTAITGLVSKDEVFRRLAQKDWQHKRITRWSYEDGVEIEISQPEALADCKEALDSGKVEIEAPRVRTYIENRLKNLTKKLGSRVRFREGSANDERSAGELIFELRKYLKEGGFFDFSDEKKFEELEVSTFITNYGSHDRPPAPVGLSIGDVNFALERLLELEDIFICPDCKRKIWNIVGRNFDMQCKCGKYSLK